MNSGRLVDVLRRIVKIVVKHHLVVLALHAPPRSHHGRVGVVFTLNKQGTLDFLSNSLQEEKNRAAPQCGVDGSVGCRYSRGD